MSLFKIQHITRYIYDDMVRDSANQVMLYPVSDDYQTVTHHTLTITGNPVVHIYNDYYGNQVGTFTYAQPHREMVIHSQLTVETREKPLPESDVPKELQWSDLMDLRNNTDFIDFCHVENVPEIGEIRLIVDAKACEDCTPFETAQRFNQYVFENFQYKKGVTTVETTISEIWKLKSGVCQDFAHILLLLLRLSGIPSRYVSGYICPNKSGMRGEGATHAWVEAYLPFYGWLGFDPTNNCIVNEKHVRLAMGKNFSDCSPVKGTYRGTSNHVMEVGVSVTYGDGKTVKSDDSTPTVEVSPTTSSYQNSFRKFQEMQMQQQQQ